MLEVATDRDLRGALIKAFIASLCGSALIAIVSILAEASIDETTTRVLMTTGALTLYSLTALACNALMTSRADLSSLGLAGIATSALGLVSVVLAIWIDQPGDDGLARFAGSLLIATLAIAHSCVLMRSPRDGSPRDLLRLATTGLGATLAALSILPIAAADGDLFAGRAVAVVAVLFLLGNVLIPLVRLIEASR